MAITDNPELNRRLNGESAGDGTESPRYCRFCGKPMVYHQKTRDGRTNPFMEHQWKARICPDCWQERAGGSGGRVRRI